MPPDIPAIIKQSVSMLDICQLYGIHVDRGGFICCPFHGEKTGSLKVYPGQRGWHCFGCNQGGDVITFVRQYFGFDFLSAIRKLNDDFGLHLPIDEQQDRETERKAREEAYKRRKSAERRQKRLKALQEARDEALTEFAKLDRVAESLASEASLCGLECMEGLDLYNIVLDGISEETAHALRQIDSAWYKLCEADARLRSFERETNNKTDSNSQTDSNNRTDSNSQTDFRNNHTDWR